MTITENVGITDSADYTDDTDLKSIKSVKSNNPCKSVIQTGYKQTEVGVIPEDWEVTSLGKRATFRTGPFGSALHKSDYTSNGVPIINPMHIINGQLVPTDTVLAQRE